jgi:hypothetical protein
MTRHPMSFGSLPLLGISIALAAAALPACSSNGNTGSGAGGSSASSATGGHNPGSGGSGSGAGGGGVIVDVGASVLMMHNHASRDGLYADAAFTRKAAAKLHKDVSFIATVSGDEYAQVLFYDAKGSGKDLLITATEQNEVSALDPKSGMPIWRKTLGDPAPNNIFGCGNVDPNGVTGTPAIDYATRTLYVASAIQDQGLPRHRIFALSLDDGTVLPSWPVDMTDKGTFTGGITFDASVHGERGAALVVGDTLYVPYGGRYGDCGDYHGWLAAIPTKDPQHPHFWATTATGGGAWGVGGPAADGNRVFFVTGNTFGASTWQGGEAVVAFAGPSLAFDNQNFFAPSNWQDLDNSDTDLGGSGVMLVDVPGSAKKLAVALGKDGNIYVLDRDHLGGIGGQLATAQAANGTIINAGAAYTTGTATYVVFRGSGSSCPGGGGGDLVAARVNASSATVAWCATQNGSGSPIVTKSGDQVIVWGVGAEGDGRLHGFDGDTGDPIFDGGGAADQMGSLNHLITPIAAKGRIYVGGSGAVYAFSL